MSDLFVSCSYLGRQKWCQQVFEGFFSIWFEDKEETADRFYKGDIQVVDEFFQIYALDNNRPKQLTQKEGK